MKLLEDFDTVFLKKLNIYLLKKKEAYSLVHSDGSKLIDILSEFMNRKSKHIRPAIFYFAYQNWKSTKVEDSEIWKVALSIEFVHALALIHDDIIDKSSLRRGKATIHELYRTETAILLGDLALTIADELYIDALTHLEMPIKQKDSLNKLYNSFKQETLIGEYLDVQKNDDIFTVMKLKTAQYTFEKPAGMGMGLAQTSQKEIDMWSRILLDLGITFQIYDDFVGSFGQEKSIGKPADSDIKEGKNTVFTTLFLERVNESDKKQFLSFFGSQEASKKDLEWFQTKSDEYGITISVCHDIQNRTKRIKTQILDIKDVGTDFSVLIDTILYKITDFRFLSSRTIDNQLPSSL